MKNKQILYLIMLLITLLYVNAAITAAITGGTSRRIFRNLTEGDEVSGYVSVQNRNDYDVVVYIDSENISFSNNEIYLEPEEEHYFNYTMFFDGISKTYTFSVKYVSQDEENKGTEFALMGTVVLLAAEPEEETIEQNETINETVDEENNDTESQPTTGGGSSGSGSVVINETIEINETVDQNITETNTTDPVIEIDWEEVLNMSFNETIVIDETETEKNSPIFTILVVLGLLIIPIAGIELFSYLKNKKQEQELNKKMEEKKEQEKIE